MEIKHKLKLGVRIKVFGLKCLTGVDSEFRNQILLATFSEAGCIKQYKHYQVSELPSGMPWIRRHTMDVRHQVNTPQKKNERGCSREL